MISISRKSLKIRAITPRMYIVYIYHALKIIKHAAYVHYLSQLIKFNQLNFSLI